MLQEISTKKMKWRFVLLQKIKRAQIFANFTKNQHINLCCSTMKAIPESAIIELSEQIVN